jgi:hypothetical protein
MSKPRRRRRRKAQRETQPRPSLTETRDIAEAAKRAAEDVRAALQRDRSLHLAMLKKKSDRKETPARFVLLLGALLACVSLLVTASILVPPAFTSPSTNLTDLGAAGVFVEAAGLDRKQTPLLEGEGITLTTYLSQRDSQATYELGFPKQFAGKGFVLALTGSAILRDFHSEGRDSSDKSVECPANISADVAYCQLIIGKVPVPTNEHDIVSASYCYPWQKNVEVISVRLSGRQRINSSPDWAHHITSLPYLGNQREIGGVSGLGEAYLGPDFKQAELSGCQSLIRNPKWTDFTPSWPPSLDKGDVMTWRENDNGAMLTVVSTERSASWKGNMLLALIGIAGGGLITLFVATFRSGMSLRKQPHS